MLPSPHQLPAPDEAGKLCDRQPQLPILRGRTFQSLSWVCVEPDGEGVCGDVDEHGDGDGLVVKWRKRAMDVKRSLEIRLATGW